MKASELQPEDRKTLLTIVRHAVREAVGADTDDDSPAFDADFPSNGAFVTLHRRGRLRGCIGTFAGSESIVATLKDMASAAALRDPRFYAVAPDEVEDLDIEISLLTPLEEVTDPQRVEVGRHGICIERGYSRGVLLPQVATENNWDRETFLDQTCVKAGLPPGTWREDETKIEVFEAVVFGEKSEGMLGA